MQAAGGKRLIVSRLPLTLHACTIGFGRRIRQGMQLGLEATAQHDVGSATGHVGSDGDCTRATRVRDDLGFALVLLGVEHFVRDVLFLQDTREQL